VAAALLILIVLINISPSTKIAQIDDRMIYQELMQRQEVTVSIPEPKIATAPASMKRTARVGKSKATAVQVEETRSAEADETYDIAELEAVTPPGEGVVRAIIDSTGMVIKVATGNTRTPEKDTMLENRLSGQQLAPPLIAGRKKRVYVDFTATEGKDD
jgi:hypothetical protein